MDLYLIYRRMLRMLLLPIDLRLEAECIEFIKSFMAERITSSVEDQSLWLEGQVREWEEKGRASQNLVELIETIIKKGNYDYAQRISDNYFDAHIELIENQLVSPEVARSFLSHLLLVTRLADEENMSCAQISKILDAMNPSAGFGRRSIEAILKKMKLAPNISIDNISDLFDADKLIAHQLFGDANLLECAEMVTEIALRLGFQHKIGKHLNSLLDVSDVEKYTPYVQILHYQCSILEYYDHHVKDFYEFSPRGNAAGHLFNLYPDSMTRAANPFLNNAKSVGQVNFPWAAAKKNQEFPGAAALFSILDGLDEMGYAARQELALWIRCYIHRYMVEAEPLDVPLPESIPTDACFNLLSNIAVRNTATRGIIEQRVVDSLTSLIHLESNGWKSRGIGDSVNASNLSKKKLGDCDFQNAIENKVVAYEAHGGALTQTYLDEHLRTLPKVAKPRIEEWSTFSSSADWEVEIVFVAHSFDAEQPSNFEIEGVNFSIMFITYSDLICSLDKERFHEVVNTHVLSPLGEKNTPSSVRQALLDLL